jgi:hypothetical protein
LAYDLAAFIQAKWTGDWAASPPAIGIHYSYWDLKALPAYSNARDELSKIPGIADKYPAYGLDKPIGMFLELVVGSIPSPSYLEKAIEFWWSRFESFLDAQVVPVRLFVGLGNFKADRAEYRLNAEFAIRYMEDKSLDQIIEAEVAEPIPLPFEGTGVYHRIHGLIQIDFSVPATRDSLESHLYTNECIRRMLAAEHTLRLSTFGRIVVGPWVPICNASFPVDRVSAFGAPEEADRFDEPAVQLDPDGWARFQALHTLVANLVPREAFIARARTPVQRRFNSAISRFAETFDQGYWESVVVDLVIVMESLLTPNKQGGRMQLALAASNLLGTSPPECREIFDNIAAMYKLRNSSVHGEPMTHEEWDKNILKIAQTAGSPAQSLDDGARAYAFEAMRDYARRTISAMLHLSNAGRDPSSELTHHLHRLHLNPELRTAIQTEARTYPLASRPPPSVG